MLFFYLNVYMLLTWLNPFEAKTYASPKIKKGCYVNHRCYLAISLNDQLHITPKTAAINQSEFAFVVLSYLRSLIPPMWNVCALFQPNGSSKKTEETLQSSKNSDVPARRDRVTAVEPGPC